MKKIIICIPVYNDWESLKKLISQISENIIGQEKFMFDCLIINDASEIKSPIFKKPKNFNKFKILNMKENKGHARCNAFILRYINQNEKFDYVILMDGDGEDRPEEIKKLLKKIILTPNISIVAKRIKRSEGPFFQLLYLMHKLITFIFTGKKINFGNYSCLIKSDVNLICSKPSLWSSYTGTIKKYIKNFSSIDSIRGKRYFGPSKMSFFRLLIHSFSIIAVFKYQVLARSIAIFLILFTLKTYLGFLITFLQFLLVLFVLIIFLVSLREKKDELLKSQNNLKNIVKIMH